MPKITVHTYDEVPETFEVNEWRVVDGCLLLFTTLSFPSSTGERRPLGDETVGFPLTNVQKWKIEQ